MALVSQQPVLFSGTIRENICFGIEHEVPLKEVEDVIEMANAKGFIATFPLVMP